MISKNIPNAETKAAIKEIEELKKNPNKKTYSNFSELLKDVEKDV